MRVNLRGVHVVTVKGVAYHYAWRGGPRLVGAPGSPEYIASFVAAHGGCRLPNAALLQSLIAGYKASKDFEVLEPRTQRDYLQQLARIETKFGNLPIAALDDPRVTRDFLDWRDGLSTGPRQADYAWMVLMRLLSWARARGFTTYRPPDRVARLYHADRSDKVWLDEHIAAFMGVASAPLQRAMVLALETGQRQGDLLALPWSAYDGAWIRLRQSKTKARANIPVTKRLRAVLESSPRIATTILTDRRGLAWREKEAISALEHSASANRVTAVPRRS
jgi:integrase